jgi:alpha-D-ribose 1-methylphosphonate 5-triphosphate diphosphatase PhnM
MKNKCIYNGKIVLTDKILEGYLIIKQGRIYKIGEGELNSDEIKDCEMIDVESMYVLPGLIDIHNDAIEKEVSEMNRLRLLYVFV